MSHRQSNPPSRSFGGSRLFGSRQRLACAVAATGLAVLVSACSNTAFESQPVDQSQTGTDEDQAAVDTTTGQGGAGEPDVLVVTTNESPYDEPDLELAVATEAEGIPEDQAVEPEDEPVPADPEDSDDVAQVALGTGESAICATVQIGRDAVTDGVEELANTQRQLLLDRVDLADDQELADLIGSIESNQPTEVAVLDAALDRCQDLGFEP